MENETFGTLYIIENVLNVHFELRKTHDFFLNLFFGCNTVSKTQYSF